jgi:hypothetical protein
MAIGQQIKMVQIKMFYASLENTQGITKYGAVA